MNGCSVAYDLLVNGYENWWFPAFGLVAGGASFLVYLVLKYVGPKPMTKMTKLSSVGGMLVSVVFIILALSRTYGDYARLAEAYRSGDYREVAGKIENFAESDPARGHGDERFTVGGVPFSYSRSIVSAGFRKTRASGGPLRDGLVVRIRYIGTAIVRLEICES